MQHSPTSGLRGFRALPPGRAAAASSRADSHVELRAQTQNDDASESDALGEGEPPATLQFAACDAVHTDAEARLFAFGEQRLSDAECLALVLRGAGVHGDPKADAVGEAASAEHRLAGFEHHASRLVRRFGGLMELASAEPEEVVRSGRVAPARAAALAAAFGLARRLVETRVRPGVTVRGGADVARVVAGRSRGEKREAFYALLLDCRFRIQSMRLVSVGGLAAAPVHPREVFRPAVATGAAAIVVAHNHPSGDPTPSKEDRAVTKRLVAAGELVGIELLDHVVVGRSRYFSFADDREHPIP